MIAVGLFLIFMTWLLAFPLLHFLTRRADVDATWPLAVSLVFGCAGPITAILLSA